MTADHLAMEHIFAYLIGVGISLTVIVVLAIARWVRRLMATMDEVHHLTASTDKSVNNRADGEPKLYDLMHATKAVVDQHLVDDEIQFADLRSRLGSIISPGKLPDVADQ